MALDWRAGLRRGGEELPLVVLAVLLLSTGAEILPPDSLISLGELKLNLERLLVIAGLIAVIAIRAPKLRDFVTGLELPLAVLLIAGLVATIKWNTEPRMRFLIEAVAIFYLAVATARTRPDVRRVLATVALVALALSALSGLAQVSQGEATGFYRDGCKPVQEAPPDVPAGTITRATGTLENPNLLAAHLLLLAPLGVLAAWGVGGRQRLALGVVVALGYVALVFTFSRAAVVIALASLALAAVLGDTRRRGLLAAAGIGAALVAGILVGSCGTDAASGDFGRTQTWRETTEVAVDNPIYGVGLGRTADLLRAENPDSTFAHGHNLFLTWWADAGTAALLAWLAIAAVLLWRTLGWARAGDRVSLALLVALAGFFALGLVDHPANVDRIAVTFWIVAGLAAAGPGTVDLPPRRSPNPPAPDAGASEHQDQ